MTIPRRTCAALLTIAQAGAAAAQAQDPGTTLPEASASDWTFQFEPATWYVAPGGKLRLPGSAATGNGDKVDLSAFNVDSPRLAPYGELHVRRGDWRLAFSAFRVATDDRGAVMQSGGQLGTLMFSAGDRIESSLDLTSADVLAAYRFFHPRKGDRDEGGFTYVPMLEAHGGFRLYDVDFDARGPGGSTSGDAFFVEPFIGARFSMDLAEQFTIDVQTSVGAFNDGGDRSTVSWNALVGFQWHPVENVGIQVGYRQLAFSLIDGASPARFDWRGAAAGLYFGAVIRF